VNVYVLIHDDRYYDMGDTSIRGIYVNRTTAESDIVTRTPSGAKSRAWGAHDTNCCSVDEWYVQEAVTPDVQDDPPPSDPKDRVIPEGFLDAVVANLATPNPYRGQR
jgi:hypothetical protein